MNADGSENAVETNLLKMAVKNHVFQHYSQAHWVE